MVLIKFKDIENNNKIVFGRLLPEDDPQFYRVETIPDKMIWNLSKSWYDVEELTEEEIEENKDEIYPEGTV